VRTSLEGAQARAPPYQPPVARPPAPHSHPHPTHPFGCTAVVLVLARAPLLARLARLGMRCGDAAPDRACDCARWGDARALRFEGVGGKGWGDEGARVRGSGGVGVVARMEGAGLHEGVVWGGEGV